MSYLLQFVRRPDSDAPHASTTHVDRREWLNLPGYHGEAAVRVYVEDTSSRRGRKTPTPKLELWISDCYNKINLEFDVSSHGLRVNSLHKIDTLLEALHGFRDGFAAEADLFTQRDRS